MPARVRAFKLAFIDAGIDAAKIDYYIVHFDDRPIIMIFAHAIKLPL